MYLKKALLLLFFIGVNLYVALAQGKHGQSAVVGTDDTQASSYVFSGYDLSNFNADDLSDADINTIKSKLQSRGISYDQAEQMAVSKGMPPTQAQKLKARLMGLSGTK